MTAESDVSRHFKLGNLEDEENSPGSVVVKGTQYLGRCTAPGTPPEQVPHGLQRKPL